MSRLKILCLLLLILAGAESILAEPTPPQIAVNHETKECAEYGCGDECADCVPPAGWVILGYAFNVTCPEDYVKVEIEPLWKPLANEFCCTTSHSGSRGDCSDVIINHRTEACAFAESIIAQCGQLPSGWEPHGQECPYSWVKEPHCSPPAATMNRRFSAAIPCGLGLVGGLFLTGVLVWMRKKR